LANSLKLQRIGQAFIDPQGEIRIDERSIKVFAGLKTAIDQFACGTALRLDVIHKIIRTGMDWSLASTV